ncbi:DUF3325 domain-containing protein [Paraburkholderia sp. J76]|uniref:DUF3325 domain-containing protein n=1 Tax=Paraburkholderia sp. J76 TaxID=2805439 RepID=UPI002ABEA14D|nr:DUF3325 domain-containing protein [Paraburkholderia sp. J76]
MPMLALLVCVPAFACLAAAMERHQEMLLGARLSAAASRVLRCAGWCALLVALWLAVAGEGWALGLVWYSGCTSLAAGVVYGLLIVYSQRRSAQR